ncbi:MAG: hypothetical protein WC792_05855 [Candidatus Micrarchaeia archaeon]|jgi:hypothetical protein
MIPRRPEALHVPHQAQNAGNQPQPLSQGPQQAQLAGAFQPTSDERLEELKSTLAELKAKLQTRSDKREAMAAAFSKTQNAFAEHPAEDGIRKRLAATLGQQHS